MRIVIFGIDLGSILAYHSDLLKFLLIGITFTVLIIQHYIY
jgi:hypothetical protein